MAKGQTLLTAGLFAGIGGIERGLESAGHSTLLLAENFPAANHVLKIRFPDAKVVRNVAGIRKLPSEIQLVSAGFPCQDLSSAGAKAGIAGAKSSLVGRVFGLLEKRRVPWVLLENVPFLLHLDRGRALRLITSSLEELGYSWAYRVLDAEAFGVPQRRKRWFLVASQHDDPRSVILAGDTSHPVLPSYKDVACGFYWSEGRCGLGWAVDSVPPIKCGPTPAIWMRNCNIVTPDIRDAERLQGFTIDWTEQAQSMTARWRLVGNAVCVPVAAWIGKRLARPVAYDSSKDCRLALGDRWPNAAWGSAGQAFASKASDAPVWEERPSLEDFLMFPTKPLSARACRGLLNRASKGNLRFPDGLLNDVEDQAKQD